MVEKASVLVLKNSQKSNLSEDSNREQHSGPAAVKPPLTSHSVRVQALADKSNLAARESNAPPSVLPAADFSMEGASDKAGPSGKDPVISSTYLLSPLRTLKESIPDYGRDYITAHDLVEAYNTLSNRIRVHIDLISSDETPSFLTIFKTNTFDIIECLTRDIRRSLPNPFESQRSLLSFAGLSCESEGSPNDEDLRTMIDDATLCQHALRFASDIFTFPALYSCFTDIQLTSLLRDIMSFCTTSAANILNLPKLRAMAIWTLKVQQLPTPILVSLKAEIISTLRSSISHQSGEGTSKLDAFKAIHCILNSHPDFVSSFTALLPLVLQHLTCDSPEVQLHAALALSSFASAKCQFSSSGIVPLKQASEHIKTFIDDQASQRNSSQSESRLISSFSGALADGTEWRRHGPSFVLTAISCFLVLLDHSFFVHPRSVKVVLAVLQKCAGHKHKSVCHIQAEVWKILFWAFSRIPLALDEVLPNGKPGLRERAYRLVCEDLRGDRRLCLIAVLLGRDNSKSTTRSEVDVQRAIDAVDKLFKVGDSTSSDHAVAILSRMVSGIGAPLRSIHHDVEQECFARTLVEGTLLSQTTRELKVPAVKISIDQLRSLSEQEVLRNWQALSALWVSMVQRDLSRGQVLSPEIIEIWQALLLVHGEITPGEQHLSASSTFSRQSASIVAGFRVELDGLDKQRLYLSSIWKLWSVMKNVFTPTWLSHPAEKMLASLLRTQFILADGKVKELWSQLCSDLISVGIPTLLHILHMRSAKQEGKEITRQLWLLLALNGPLTNDQENWEDLLQFLIMPFSVWDMSPQEFDIWKDIFQRAFEIAAKTSKAVESVISRFLSLFKDVKLASLKASSRTLHWLLLQVTTSTGYLTDITLLSMIDDCMFSSYASHVEAKAQALEILRVIGGLIPAIGHSEIVGFLSTLQQGMSRWIADENKLLEDHEDKELVDILYKPSLQLLAKVEPSIEVLQSVATFMHSVFVRIRGDGPLLFHDFWRATYHTRKDILQEDYPLPIRLCLKSWSDITADSLADDISLDSGSQSLRSFIIPDSQSMGELESVEADFTFDLSCINEDGPFHVVTYDYSKLAGADAVSMPSSQAIASGEGSDHEPAGTSPAENNCTRNNITADEGNLGPMKPGPSTFPELFASVVKRSADNELPRTPKRPRTNIFGGKFEGGPSNARSKGLSRREYYAKSFATEPLTQEPSPYVVPPRSASQERRLKGDTPSWIEKAHIPRAIHEQETMATSDDCDYDSWEQGLSADDLRQVREELQHHSDLEVVLDSEDHPSYTELDTEPMTELDDSEDGHDVLSPSLGDYPLQSKRRRRSQTAPELSPTSHSISAQPLRRNQTTPLERQKSSAQLEALQQAYAIVADTGTSQIDVQDIMQARRLANQINQILDEQMFTKVVDGKRPP
ncbi:hypothetical protein CPB84DRAFT_1773418 [Gymnopilus junonius]|uniref:Telomere-associated protein Rif1 N-terminal domain-containing protein n=1 Tax=Gymnopilus junonius TaxID=109634 RepID=A0A9P5TQ74_GYMJU|nr:hypothetical protein CPB84DRAFT_1773418 [Gymnopilus junonius]